MTDDLYYRKLESTSTTDLVDMIREKEKRIEELEQKLEQTEKDLADYQFNYPTIKELQKENAELKDYRLTTLAKQQTDMSKYALNLEHKLSWYDDQLTKAKEIIKKLCIRQDDYCIDCTCYKFLENMRAEAEQFLKENE